MKNPKKELRFFSSSILENSRKQDNPLLCRETYQQYYALKHSQNDEQKFLTQAKSTFLHLHLFT